MRHIISGLCLLAALLGCSHIGHAGFTPTEYMLILAKYKNGDLSPKERKALTEAYFNVVRSNHGIAERDAGLVFCDISH